MDIERIKAIADIFEQKGLTYLEVTEGVSTIRLEKKGEELHTIKPLQHAIKTNSPCQLTTEIKENDILTAPPDENLLTVNAPLAGIFYSAPSPELDPFVKVGARVKKGDVLCIIEAMKVMNELTSDYDGEIAEICIKNGQIVEFNQPIIKIKQ